MEITIRKSKIQEFHYWIIVIEAYNRTTDSNKFPFPLFMNFSMLSHFNASFVQMVGGTIQKVALKALVVLIQWIEIYHIYLCISRPFTAYKLVKKNQ